MDSNMKYVYNLVIKFMKDNKVTCIDDLDSDLVFSETYQFLEDLFNLVENDVNKIHKVYQFSVATKKNHVNEDYTEVWISVEDGSDFDEEDNSEVYKLVNKLKFDYMSESCYNTPFYPNYVKTELLKSGYFKHSEEMQNRMIE